MLPASNSGVGMNMGFPDVCVTPVGPVPTPIPYPNMAMNATAVPFAPNVLISFVPGLNMGAEDAHDARRPGRRATARSWARAATRWATPS